MPQIYRTRGYLAVHNDAGELIDITDQFRDLEIVTDVKIIDITVIDDEAKQYMLAVPKEIPPA